jgi:hypothetical protein
VFDLIGEPFHFFEMIFFNPASSGLKVSTVWLIFILGAFSVRIMLASKKISYWLRGQLYISVTSKVNSLSLVQIRGPNFVLPACSGFQMLPDDYEPTSEEIFNEVDYAVETGKVKVDSMSADPVTFAGYGEPLLRREIVIDAAKLIKESRHGLPLRLKTNGLVPADQCEEVEFVAKYISFHN